VDARSDLYSLGVVLYELTAGRRPFEADSTYGILDAQLNTPPKPPLQLNPSLPPLLNDVILTALAKDPAQRFQTAEAFRRAVETVQQKSTVQAPAGAFPPAAAKRSFRGLWMAAGALACLCVLAGAALLAPRFLKTSAHSDTPVTTAAPAPKPLAQQHAVSNTPSQSTPVAEQATPAPQQLAPAAQQKPRTEQMTRLTVPAAATRMQREAARPPAPQNPVAKPPAVESAAVPAATSSYPPVSSPAVQQPQPQQPAGPSQQELDEASETLVKLQARADAVKNSLNRMRESQAASGLEIRQDIAAAASRLDSHMRAAEAALQGNRLDAAKSNMAHADEDLTKLEAFFGR
jgi:eukaryotic-like serine/threonine-protein kinase